MDDPVSQSGSPYAMAVGEEVKNDALVEVAVDVVDDVHVIDFLKSQAI